MSLKVTIDTREQNRIKTATEYYKGQGVEVNVEELPIGDYIFTDGKNEVVFEYKTIDDFVSSIQTNRIFNQAINQAEEYDHHYVIIVGGELARAKAIAMSKHYREVSYHAYLGAIASLNRYTTVIESYNPNIIESFYRMLIQAKKCLQDKPIVKRFPRKDKNPAFNFLCHDIYGINTKKAQQIVNTFNLYSKKDLDRLTKEELLTVDGIADKTAEKILKAIGE